MVKFPTKSLGGKFKILKRLRKEMNESVVVGGNAGRKSFQRQPGKSISVVLPLTFVLSFSQGYFGGFFTSSGGWQLPQHPGGSLQHSDTAPPPAGPSETAISQYHCPGKLPRGR